VSLFGQEMFIIFKKKNFEERTYFISYYMYKCILWCSILLDILKIAFRS